MLPAALEYSKWESKFETHSTLYLSSILSPQQHHDPSRREVNPPLVQVILKKITCSHRGPLSALSPQNPRLEF